MVIPEGCILNAPRPYPVSVRHVVGQLLPDLMMGCLHQAVPDRVNAEGSSALWNPPLRGGAQVSGAEAELPDFEIITFNSGGTGATFSVASTGMVRTPEGKAVPSSPSLVGRAPVPPELKVMISKSGNSAAAPLTCAPPRSGGFQSAEEPSAFTRSGTAWCRQPIIRSGSSWPTTWRTLTG